MFKDIIFYLIKSVVSDNPAKETHCVKINIRTIKFIFFTFVKTRIEYLCCFMLEVYKS